MIGETVGNFEIISRLGKGGMGEVYLAQQKSIKTKVAIKVLQSDVSTNTTHVQRFFNEAVAVSQIHHSGIVKIFDVGFHSGGQAYLVMEYLEGETLTKRIKRLGRLDVAHVADFGRQIASVLDATHAANITHRDLKPDNIYLVRDAELPLGERVKILDFGIAKLAPPGGPRMTALSVSSIGTPTYMSPEQWHSLAEVDWRTDAYALGCVAFEMACGRPPFVAESLADMCAQHMTEPPPVPSTLVPGLPGGIDAIVARLLEKEPAARATMRDAIAAFTAIGMDQGLPLPRMSSPLVPQPTEPPPPAATTTHEPPAHRRSRLPWLIGLGALAVGGTVGAAVVISSSRSPGPPPPVAPEAVAPEPVATVSADAASAPDATAVGVAVAVDAGLVVELDAGVAVASDAAVAAPDDAPLTEPKPVQLLALPARKSGIVPAVRDAIDLTVCIDADGNVTSAEGKGLPSTARALVMRWRYAPHLVDGAPTPACGPAKIPAKQVATTPTPKDPPKEQVERGDGVTLTQKQFEAAIKKVRGAVSACDRFPVQGLVEAHIVVSPGGKPSTQVLSPHAGLNQCIAQAISKATFPRTQNGGTGRVSFKFRGSGTFGGEDPDDPDDYER